MCLGIPGQVIAITDPDRLLGTVDVSGVRREVNLACVVEDGDLDGAVGAWVLVHVGFAMNRIDADEAAATLKALEDLGEAMAEIEAIRDADAMMAGDAPRDQKGAA
jgi:hydrogenase expression/formation protein HypC